MSSNVEKHKIFAKMAELEETHRELMETTRTHLLETYQSRSENESLIEAFESCKKKLCLQIEKKQNALEKVQARLDERIKKQDRIYELSNKVFGIFNKANGLDSEKMELALKQEAARQCFLMPSRKNKRRRLELLASFDDKKMDEDMENKKLKLATPSSGEEQVPVLEKSKENDSENSKNDDAVDFSEMAAQYYEALSKGKGSLVHEVEEELRAIENRPEDCVKQEQDRESSSESSEEYSSDDAEDSADVKTELKSDNSSGNETGEEDSSEDEENVPQALEAGIKVEPSDEIFKLLYSGDSSSSGDKESVTVKREFEEMKKL